MKKHFLWWRFLDFLLFWLLTIERCLFSNMVSFWEYFLLFVPGENQYLLISEPSSFPLSPLSEACSLSILTPVWVSSSKQKSETEKEGNAKLKSHDSSTEVCTRQFLFISESEWQPIQAFIWLSCHKSMNSNQISNKDVQFYFILSCRDSGNVNGYVAWVEKGYT